MTAAEQAETRAQQRAQEAAERAEWDRLSKIYFAHMNAVAPNQFHCFCGSLDDLRHAVARLDREAARDSAGRPSAPRADRSASRGVAEVQQDQTRRAQLAHWYGEDRAAEQGTGDGDAD